MYFTIKEINTIVKHIHTVILNCNNISQYSLRFTIDIPVSYFPLFCTKNCMSDYKGDFVLLLL